VVEKVLEDVSFQADAMRGRAIRVDAAYVREKLDKVLQDEDLSRYIL
jgi:ATP-dependent HslUV protease ATP-binding subunit HslU